MPKRNRENELLKLRQKKTAPEIRRHCLKELSDRIAIKSTFTQKKNLPFDNHGKTVGTMIRFIEEQTARLFLLFR